jgi:hypothetical protein
MINPEDEGVTSQAEYTLSKPSNCPNDRDHFTSTTDANGSLKLTVGNPGIVTVSKSGFTTISVGYESGSTLRIELPSPASLSGSVYDMATRRAVGDAYVSVVADYSVNPHSNAVLTENGSFSFNGLPPSPTVLMARAPGFAPTIASTTLIADDSHNVNVGMLLEGAALLRRRRTGASGPLGSLWGRLLGAALGRGI